MLIYHDNMIKSLFSDSNFNNDSLVNFDEDENEIIIAFLSKIYIQ